MEVKEVEYKEQSTQEVEQELLDKHAVENASDVVVEEETEEEEVVEEEVAQLEINEESVLNFLENEHGKQFKSIDELIAPREVEKQELPEDVAAYYKYKKETGRGFNDFMKLNKYSDDIDPETLLRDYHIATEKGLDEDDIDGIMLEYSYDEELDDESDIRRKKRLKNTAIAKAKDYFESEKEKYSTPLESSGMAISDEDKKLLEEYKQYASEESEYEEKVKIKSDWFKKKTNEVFGGEFKGFEFAIDENKNVIFSPGDATELKKLQENPAIWMQKFLNEDGLLEDAVGYHKSLAVAMNPEKFAKHFYEQGKADGAEGLMSTQKNISMSTIEVPDVHKKEGVQYKAVNPDSGSSLKIKSKS